MSNMLKIKELTTNQLQELSNLNSISAILTELDITTRDGRARKLLRSRLEEHNITLGSFSARKGYTVDDVREAVEEAICYADVVRAVGLSQSGGNTKTIQRIIEVNNIDVSHFDTAKAIRRNKDKWKFEDIFCENSKYFRSGLANAVERFGVLEYKCVKCGNPGEWMEEPITLDVDHINGINDDNRIENLRYLCPNCHRQTDTWGRRDK